LTTVVSNDEGQSLLEFLIALPMMIGISMLLVRVNTAIQASIVQQKYARGAIHFFTWNSPYYPEKNFSGRMGYGGSPQGGAGSNDFVLGVSGKTMVDGSGSNRSPQSLEVGITRNGPKHPPQGIPEESRSVYLRNSLNLCTKSHLLGDGSLPRFGGAGLNEQSTFNFCRGRFD